MTGQDGRLRVVRIKQNALQVLMLMRFPWLVALLVVLPPILLGPTAFAIRRDFPFERSDIGATFATFFLASATVSLFGGPVVRRCGAFPVIRAALVGTAAVSGALAMSTSKEVVYAACIAGGVFNGLSSVAVSLTIMSEVPAHRRGLAFGLRMAGLPSAAAVAGLGAYVVAAGHSDWRTLQWGVAGAALVVALTTRSRSPRGATGSVSTIPTTEIRGSQRTLSLLGVAGLLGSVGTAVVTPFLVEGLIASGQTPTVAASILATAGWFGIVSRVAIGALSDRFPDPLTHLRLSAFLMLVLSASLLMLAHGTGVAMLVGATILVFGLGFAWPGLLLFATLATHHSHAASAAGQMQVGQHSGAVIGPLAFGLVLSQQSFAAAWSATALVLLVGAVLLLCVARSLRAPATAQPVYVSDGTRRAPDQERYASMDDERRIGEQH